MVNYEKSSVEIVNEYEANTLYYFRFTEQEITTLKYNMRKHKIDNIPDFLKALIRIGLKK